MPLTVKVPRPDSNEYPEMLDVLMKNIESVSEMVHSYSTREAMDDGDASGTVGYIFDKKTIARFIKGYCGPDQFLSEVEYGGRVEDYNPLTHVSLVIDESVYSPYPAAAFKEFFTYAADGKVRRLDGLETTFLESLYAAGLNGRTALTELAISLAAKARSYLNV